MWFVHVCGLELTKPKKYFIQLFFQGVCFLIFYLLVQFTIWKTLKMPYKLMPICSLFHRSQYSLYSQFVDFLSSIFTEVRCGVLLSFPRRPTKVEKLWPNDTNVCNFNGDTFMRVGAMLVINLFANCYCWQILLFIFLFLLNYVSFLIPCWKPVL